MAKSIIALLLFGLISSKAASQSFLMHRELPKGVKILLNADKNSKVIYKGKDIAIVKSKAGFLVTANEPVGVPEVRQLKVRGI